MAGEELGISAFAANSGATNGTERVHDPLLPKMVLGEVVIAAVPGNLGLEGVDHEIAVDVADGACELSTCQIQEYVCEPPNSAYQIKDSNMTGDLKEQSTYNYSW